MRTAGKLLKAETQRPSTTMSYAPTYSSTWPKAVESLKDCSGVRDGQHAKQVPPKWRNPLQSGNTSLGASCWKQFDKAGYCHWLQPDLPVNRSAMLSPPVVAAYGETLIGQQLTAHRSDDVVRSTSCQ